MACDKCRSKAMALVAAAGGVDSVAIAGDAKDQLVVVGDGVDSINLTSSLRKKVGPAQLVQVADAGKKKEEEEKPVAADAVTVYPSYYNYYPQPATVVYEYPPTGYAYGYGYGYQSRPDNTCSIMHAEIKAPELQRIVIQVEMSDNKCRSKAMALVAATGGVDSVALAGDAKDQVVVVGDGVDSVKLTSALRKKVGPAQLLQVADAGKKKEEEKKPAIATTATVYPYQYYQQPATVVYEYPAAGYTYGYGYQSRPDNTCSIM
ncbi:hypothetical protein EJB05_21084, partial [Eragrostis curvula]